MEKSIQKKGVKENTSMKDLGLYYRIERGVCTGKEKGILLVEGEKRGSTGICRRSVEKRIHLTFQVIPNITSTLCGKKGWHMENSIRLSVHKPMDNKEWVSLTPYHRYTRWSRKEKDVYKAGSEMEIQ